MRCNEIQERFVDLLYQEQGTPSASPELQAHIRSCPACQKELAEFKELQTALRIWHDEPPLRPVTVPRAQSSPIRLRIPFWRVVRYAAVAALVTLAFLGLSNAQVNWDKNGFALKTSLLAPAAQATNSYTKEEVKTIIDRVMADYQDYNFQMMQRILDTVDQERANDYRSITRQIKGNRSKN